jgi:hypothetical protein
MVERQKKRTSLFWGKGTLSNKNKKRKLRKGLALERLTREEKRGKR